MDTSSARTLAQLATGEKEIISREVSSFIEISIEHTAVTVTPRAREPEKRSELN